MRRWDLSFSSLWYPMIAKCTCFPFHGTTILVHLFDKGYKCTRAGRQRNDPSDQHCGERSRVKILDTDQQAPRCRQGQLYGCKTHAGQIVFTLVLMFPSPFLSKTLKASQRVFLSSSETRARMALLSASERVLTRFWKSRRRHSAKNFWHSNSQTIGQSLQPKMTGFGKW